MFVPVNSCSGEAEIPFCVSARARKCLAFSDFIALAVYSIPFPAKRNGGGVFVCSGSIGNGNLDNVVFCGIMINRQRSLKRNTDKPASAVVIEQPTSIPFGQTVLARKRPPFRKPLLFRKETALPGRTESRTLQARRAHGRGAVVTPWVDERVTFSFLPALTRCLFPFHPALARRRFRFASLPVRGNAWLFRISLRLRFTASLFRQNGMAVGLSLI